MTQLARSSTFSLRFPSRMHHLALGAQDVEAVASFYRQAFLLSEMRRHHDNTGRLRSIWLDLGGVVLMVEQTNVPRERVESHQAGAFLLAFTVQAGEREAAEARLTQLGAPPETRTEFTTYFRDPEDNRVALSCYSFDEARRESSTHQKDQLVYSGSPAENSTTKGAAPGKA